MSKLQLKKTNVAAESAKDKFSKKNAIEKSQSRIKYLFTSELSKEDVPSTKESSQTTEKSCRATSKYFKPNDEPDESASNFLPERTSKKKIITKAKNKSTKDAKSSKSTAKKSGKKSSKDKNQQSINKMISKKIDNLQKYTEEFEKVCKLGGVDVNPEHLQLAIALSRSLVEFEGVDSSGNVNSTPEESSDGLKIEEDRVKKIRSTLDQFGFKIHSGPISLKVSKGNKRGRKSLKTTSLLLTKSIEERRQVIADKVKIILAENESSVNVCDYNFKANEVTSYDLKAGLCKDACVFYKSKLIYGKMQDEIDVYYVLNLISPSSCRVGCLLKDWASIPGREKSPEKIVKDVDFRDSNVFLDNLDVLLSSSISDFQKLIDVSKICSLNKSDNVSSTSTQSTSKADNNACKKLSFVEESFQNYVMGTCSNVGRDSPDMFEDDDIAEENVQEALQINVENNKVAAIEVADSSDDELPRVYISQVVKKSSQDIKNTSFNVSLTPPVLKTLCESNASVASSVIKKISNLNQSKEFENSNVDDNLIPTSDCDISGDDKSHESQIICSKKSSDASDCNVSTKSVKNISTSSNMVESCEFKLNRSNDLQNSIDSNKIDLSQKVSFCDLSVSDDSGKIYENADGIVHFESFHEPHTENIQNLSISLISDEETDNLSGESAKKGHKEKDDAKFKDMSIEYPPEKLFNHSYVRDNYCESDNLGNLYNDLFTREDDEIFENSKVDDSLNIDLTQSSDSQISNSPNMSHSSGNKHRNTDENNSNVKNSIDSPWKNASILKNTSEHSVSFSNESVSENSGCNDAFSISDEDFNYSINKSRRKNKKSFPCDELSSSKNSLCKVDGNGADFMLDETKEKIFETDTAQIPIETINRFTGNFDLYGSSFFNRKSSCATSCVNNIDKTLETRKSHVDISESCEKNFQKCEQNDVSYNNLKEDVSCANNVKSFEVGSSCQTPENDKYLIKTRDFTPVQDYSKMDTPVMMKELSRFGLKPVKRKRAIQLLEHIYDQTHPLLKDLQKNKKRKIQSESNENVIETESNIIITVPEINTNIDLLNSPTCSYIRKDADEFSSGPRIKSRLKKCVKKIIDFKENVNSNAEEKNAVDIYVPDCENVAIKEIACDPELWIFQKKEKAKVQGCRVPLHVAFHNYLSLRSKLRDAILRYHPVNIDTIHKSLAKDGHKYEAKDLFHFMDEKCITIKTIDKCTGARGGNKKSK